ncbi:MAG TPA: hypothetical protein VI612_05495 [Candidatus Nanoarchaeia archaeon]|nr:hypothetical protein [Candidatus Nanoarchaeia archaeon]
MAQLFFLLEHNLAPLQPILRTMGHSTFLPYEPEIGLPMQTDDPIIIARIVEQKMNLGIDRIIITKDKKFLTHIGTAPIKLIVLIDKTTNYEIYDMNLKQLCGVLVDKALKMVGKEGQVIDYIECSKFY